MFMSKREQERENPEKEHEDFREFEGFNFHPLPHSGPGPGLPCLAWCVHVTAKINRNLHNLVSLMLAVGNED